jgi:hypothetical protein
MTPLCVEAQELAPRNVKSVYVLSTAGEELHGQLLALGPQTMTLLVSGTRHELPLDSVLRVQTSGDPLKNGALIGGLVGLVWCALICGQGLDDAGYYVSAVAANTGFFMFIGMGIDASIVGRTTIYGKASPPGAARENTPRPALSLRLRF